MSKRCRQFDQFLTSFPSASVLAMDGVLDGLLSSIRSLNEDAPGAAGGAFVLTRAHPLTSATNHSAPSWHSARSARSALVRSEVMQAPGGMCGIGAKIGQQGRHVVITATCCGGPADRGGVAQGDIIRQVRRAQGSQVLEGLGCRAPAAQPPNLRRCSRVTKSWSPTRVAPVCAG